MYQVPEIMVTQSTILSNQSTAEYDIDASLMPVIKFNADFDIIKKMGEGRFGVVYEVIDKSDQKKYAIKQIILNGELMNYYRNLQKHIIALIKMNCLKQIGII